MIANRSVAFSAQRAAAAPARRAIIARAADVPDNVVEARQWINNWQAKQDAAKNRTSWFPGHPLPDHLDGSLPADYGFDPLGLGKDPEALKWYVQGELMNGRTAMLAVAGILGPELFTNMGIQWPGAGVAWYDAGKFDYFAPASSLFAVQMLLWGFVEARRYQDYMKPGSANQDPIFSNNKLPDGNTPGYPGGIFDPFGWSKGDLATLKVKELKNGRLAMVAFLGFAAQAYTTGLTPLAGLSKHLADPWSTTVFQNPVHTKVWFPFL